MLRPALLAEGQRTVAVAEALSARRKNAPATTTGLMVPINDDLWVGSPALAGGKTLYMAGLLYPNKTIISAVSGTGAEAPVPDLFWGLFSELTLN